MENTMNGKSFRKFMALWSGDMIASIGSGLTAFALGVYSWALDRRRGRPRHRSAADSLRRAANHVGAVCGARPFYPHARGGYVICNLDS